MTPGANPALCCAACRLLARTCKLLLQILKCGRQQLPQPLDHAIQGQHAAPPGLQRRAQQCNGGLARQVRSHLRRAAARRALASELSWRGAEPSVHANVHASQRGSH